MHPSLCIQCTVSAETERQRRYNEGQKRKAPTRKNPYERLTVKTHTLECNVRISQYPIYGNSFDKTSVHKTESPTLPTKYPAWNAGLRQSGGFFMPPKRRSIKSRAEPPTGNATLYKGRSLSIRVSQVHRDIKRNKPLPTVAVSRPEPHDVSVSKQMESSIIFCNSCKPFFFCVAHKRHHIKASPAWYAL